MINTKIYINSELIDISDDISLSLTYSIADIREPEKRNTNFSKTVVLPGTHFNNKLFGHLWNINSSVNSSGTTNFNPSFNPNLKADAIITYKDSIQFTGIVQLLNINVLDNNEIEYECAFLGQLGNIFQAIDNLTLDQINLDEYDHLYTAQNQKNSWDYAITKNGASYPFTLGEGYVYPMIDFGYNNQVDWNIKHFFPAIYLKTIIDKIINAAGYQYESNFFNSDLFKRLIIPYNGNSVLKLTDAQVKDRTFRATSSGTTTINLINSSTTTISIGDESTLPNFDTGGVYNNTTNRFTVPKNGTYTFRFKPKASITHFPSASTTLAQTGQRVGWFRLLKESSPVPAMSGQMMSIPVWLMSGVGLAGNVFNLYNNGTTVTSGTTTIESDGELSFTSWAWEGDVILCEFYQQAGQIYSTGIPSATNYARLNVNVGTLFATQMTDTNIQEGDTVSISNILPAKYKQSELLQSVIKAFNLFIQPDKLIANKLKIEPRVDFMDNTISLDWSEKLDTSKQLKILPMGELNTKRYRFSYKKDEDYWNKTYYAEHNENYGERILDIENDFLKGEIKTELIFSPTPLCDTLGLDRIISKIYDVDEQGTIKPKASNIRLLYYGGVKTTNQPYNYIATSGTTSMSTYGYAGHVDNPTQPTIDLSFGVPKEVFYLTDYYTGNNLFNTYWKDYYDEIIDNNSKIVVAYFHLNEADINALDFTRSYYFKEESWRLNKVVDYNPMTTDTTKCEFIRLRSTPPYIQDTGVVIRGGVKEILEELAPVNSNRTLSTNSYGIKSYGEYNVLPAIGSGILVTGSYNNVGYGSENVTILGSSGVTILGGLTNVTLINSNDVTVTESNTSYVNGVAVSTSTPKVYKALLTQTGTDAPVATVLVNTLSGTPVWTRSGTGEYHLTLTSEFLSGKTYVLINSINDSADGIKIGALRVTDNYILVTSVNAALTLTDGYLNAHSITIEVYP